MTSPFHFTIAISGFQPDGSYLQMLCVNESTADFNPSMPPNVQAPWAHNAAALASLTGPINGGGNPLPGTWEPAPCGLPNGWLFYGPGFLPFWVLFVRWNIRH